jgi:hypothetical protein
MFIQPASELALTVPPAQGGLRVVNPDRVGTDSRVYRLLWRPSARSPPCLCTTLFTARPEIRSLPGTETKGWGAAAGDIGPNTSNFLPPRERRSR